MMKAKLMCIMILVVCCTVLLAPQIQAAQVVESGSCGENVTWTVYDDSSVLIKGTGEIANHDWTTCNIDVKKIVIEEGVTSIGSKVFYCSKAEEIILPTSLNFVGEEAFAYADIEKLYMPDSLNAVGEYAFSSCDEMKEVKISAGLTKMSKGMFLGCSELKELVIPDSVIVIENSALSGLANLEKLIIGSGVTRIDNNNLAATTLREIQNNSTIDLSLTDYNVNTTNIIWKVDGMKTNIVKAGKTALGTGKKYKLTYKKMKGVTYAGKRPKTYEYGVDTKMPEAKKKGYVFLGWNMVDAKNKKEKIWDEYYNYLPRSMTGKKILMPRFVKVSIKKKGKNKFQITTNLSEAKCYLSGISIRYSTDPTMKTFKTKVQMVGENKKKQNRFTIKNAKKGKKYYIQFLLAEHELVWDALTEGDISTWAWSKTKVYKMK